MIHRTMKKIFGPELRLGIDASNLRAGGGVTHLAEVLRVARPEQAGIKRVTLWAGAKTLQEMPTRTWLVNAHEPMLDQPLPLRLWWQQFKLARLARECCDILFVPGGNYRGTFRPMVAMFRNLLPFEGREMGRFGFSWQFFHFLLLRLSQTATLRDADGVIFLTEYARSVILKHARTLRGPWAVIPHGINVRFRFPPRPQREISSFSHAVLFRFLYVSTVDQYKHQWNVAEAVAELRRAGWPVALDLVGSAYGPALKHLQAALLRLDPQGSYLRYHGLVPFSQLHLFYQRADAFIFASSCENLPHILLEAMGAGLPIVCSNRGPMPEVLQEGGIYFDPESPQELARALAAFLAAPELRERCAACAYELSREYSWERTAQDTFSFVARVARNWAAAQSGIAFRKDARLNDMEADSITPGTISPSVARGMSRPVKTASPSPARSVLTPEDPKSTDWE